MAKKPANRAAAAKQAAPADVEVPVIRENQFRQLVTAINAAKKKITSENGSMRNAIAKAAKDNNLHPGALRKFKMFDDMEPTKRSEELHHFDLYRSWADWDDQMDLWRQQRVEVVQTKRPESCAGNGAEEEATA